MTRSPPLIAFDFDGTLSVNDTFLAFLRWRQGPVGYHLGLVALAPAFVKFLIDRQIEPLKAAAVRVFLKGVPLETLESDAQRFAAQSVMKVFRPDAVVTWRSRRAEGAYLVIVTASPEPVIRPFADRLSADRLIGTRLAVDERGCLTGALQGANCRGPEKVRRLKEAFGEDVRLKAAYGDTDGDVAMLEIAEEPYMRVFKGDPKRWMAR